MKKNLLFCGGGPSGRQCAGGAGTERMDGAYRIRSTDASDPDGSGEPEVHADWDRCCTS